MSACCPNNGQRVAVGRRGEKRVHEDYHSRLTFFYLKRGAPFCLSPLRSATTTFCPQAEGIFLSNRSPSLAAVPAAVVVFFFFCQSSVPLHQNCVAFCRRRRPDGGCLHAFSRPRLRLCFSLLGGADKQRLFAPFVLIVSIT